MRIKKGFSYIRHSQFKIIKLAENIVLMFSPAVGNGFQLPKFKYRDLTGDSKYPLFTE